MGPPLHAGLIARRAGGRWAGVLIEGPSGAGKSDLALRALLQGWRLVADDRVLAWRSAGRLYGRSPEVLSGLIEARGVGVGPGGGGPELSRIDMAAVHVERPDRLPAPRFREVAGVVVPTFDLNLLELSAATKLTFALERVLAAAGAR